MTVQEYLEMMEPVQVRYKGMIVTDHFDIDDRYVLLVCLIPLPYGGTYTECVEINAIVEVA